MVAEKMKEFFRGKSSKRDSVCIPGQDDTPSDSTFSSTSPSISDTVSVSKSTYATNGEAMTKLTVVELFQSQGCSSCPPANDNVLKLVDDADKLVLTYEVTYWDYIGWPDTFGRPEWDHRQRDYSAAFKSRTVYTPQVSSSFSSSGALLTIL